MEVGMIGLGRMGGNMTARLLSGGHEVVVYDREEEAVRASVGQGARGATSIQELVGDLEAPRVVWVMAPAGEVTEGILRELASELSAGDVVVDGGNSNYRESMRRASELKDVEIGFLDAGTSGGVWGLREGYCLMVGGEREHFERVEPLLRTLAPSPERGYAHVGPAGAGHFVKMAHNGIEYGMMQAYAEGFELMRAKTELGLDLPRIAELWRSGSVVRSWLLDLAAAALEEDPGSTRWMRTWRTRARAGGRWRSRSRCACPRRCWRCRYRRGSGRGRMRRLGRSCWRRCGGSSEGTRSGAPGSQGSRGRSGGRNPAELASCGLVRPRLFGWLRTDSIFPYRTETFNNSWCSPRLVPRHGMKFTEPNSGPFSPTLSANTVTAVDACGNGAWSGHWSPETSTAAACWKYGRTRRCWSP